MNENLLKILSLYCVGEMETLKNNEVYVRLQNLVNELNYSLVCEYGKESDNNTSENIYLSISIFNDKNEMVEIFDEGFLTASTPLVLVEKKNRYRFISWEEEEFIEDLGWLIKELEKINSGK